VAAGLSQLAISKLVGYSNVSIGKWLDQYSQQQPALGVSDEVSVIELDELHHFVGKQSASAGFGLLWMAFADDCWIGNMALVAPKPFVHSLSGSKSALNQNSTAQTTGKFTARSFQPTGSHKTKP
jgi:hypothetical protein